MEYKVLAQQFISDLETEISNYLDNGWIPQGGICVGSHSFYQAIVRSNN